jgi:hypothetical protein
MNDLLYCAHCGSTSMTAIGGDIYYCQSCRERTIDIDDDETIEDDYDTTDGEEE